MAVLLLIFIGILVFLFCLFALSKEDYVLLRKNISVEMIFNEALLTVLVGLLFARIFFVGLHFHLFYLNPLAFLLFTYFPGLSLVGGVIGGCLFLLFYSNMKKRSLGRVFDFFALSFFFALPFGYAIYFYFIQKTPVIIFTIVPIVALVFFYMLLQLLKRADLKDGVIGALSLIAFAALGLFIDLVYMTKKLALGADDVLFLGTLIVSLILLVLIERQSRKLRRPRQ